MKKDQDHVDFKELHSTVDQKGKRRWIYALKPEGKWYNYRTYLSYIYLLLFFAIPFLKINGNPIFLFNIPKGEFVFFTVLFTPQDFVMFGLGMLIFIFIVIVFTMIYGRLFCGWVCPQTIFLEMVFRKIEYWIEGNANRQRVNDSKNWTTELIVRKGLKHFVFLLVSFAVSNTFLLYIIGRDEWIQLVTDPIGKHIGGLVAIIFFTLAFYAVFAFVREIVCTVICPYGRLQGVLVDSHTLAISYDYLRGEPRTKHKTSDYGGDCIDCNLCVQVCPTGIDIRNGSSQLECTQCSACIDACNMMMEKVKRPTGLIKYASAANIESRLNFSLTNRVKVFSTILAVLIGLLGWIIISRSVVDITILKVPGQVMKVNDDGSVSNFYSMKLTNKGKKPITFNVVLDENKGVIEGVGHHPDSVLPDTKIDYLFFVTVPADFSKDRKTKVKVQVLSGEKIVLKKKLDFIMKL